MEKFTTGTGQRLLVHDKKDCSGYCPIHNPSNHHMKDWPLHWRDDRRMFERICSHGVGHPDPDDLEYRKSLLPSWDKGEYLGIHGCDGCCAPPKNKLIKEDEMEIK